MPRYIDAEKLKTHYSWWECTESGNEQKKVFDAIIDLQPTADVVERKDLDTIAEAHEQIGYEKGYRDGYAQSVEGDLISRQAAIAYAISGLTREIDGEKWIRVSEVRESIKELPSAPTADVVPVVRCKECVRHNSCNFEQYQGLDGFCSLGERINDG